MSLEDEVKRLEEESVMCRVGESYRKLTIVATISRSNEVSRARSPSCT
jgi:hypothetical protein